MSTRQKIRILPQISFVLLMAGHPASHGETSAQPEINVMSFNIRYGTAGDGENHWNNRKEQVSDVIRKYSPDIVGLQEALRFQIDEIRKSLPEYGEIGIGREGGTNGEYSAILYRIKRFDVDESGTFWLSDTPEIPSAHWGNTLFRTCTWGRFSDKQSGVAFYLYNVHLDHRSQPSRERSVQLIADSIQKRKQPDPVILTGDFNAGEANPAIEYLKGKGDVRPTSPILLEDTFRTLYPSEKTVGTFNGFKGKSGSAKIDYIFATPDIRTLAASIVRDERKGRYPSDHFPLVAQLRLGKKSKLEIK